MPKEVGHAVQRVELGRRGPQHAFGRLAKPVNPHRAMPEMRGGGGVPRVGRVKGHLRGGQAEAVDAETIDIGMGLEDAALFHRKNGVEGIGEAGALDRRREHLGRAVRGTYRVLPTTRALHP